MFVKASLILVPDTIRQSYETNQVDPPVEETRRKTFNGTSVCSIIQGNDFWWSCTYPYLVLWKDHQSMHWLAGDRIHLSHHVYDGYSKDVELSSSANDGMTIIKVSSNPSKRTLQAMKIVS